MHRGLNSTSFCHLIFDIDLTLGFWDLTFRAISEKFFRPFDCEFSRKVLHYPFEHFFNFGIGEIPEDGPSVRAIGGQIHLKQLPEQE